MPRRTRPKADIIRRDEHGRMWLLDTQCTAITRGLWPRGERRCKNPAWWVGGRCSRHLDPAWTFGDWLAGWVTGAECGLMPGLRLLEIEGRIQLDGDGRCGPFSPEWLARHSEWVPVTTMTFLLDITIMRIAPRIALRVGNRSSGPLKTRAWASAEDAQVQVDKAMADGKFDPSGYHGERVLHRLAEVVRDAQLLTEWMQRDGAPVPELSTTYVGQC